MTPEGWGSALAFLLFVAPGIAFDLLSRRRRAAADESTFREVSRVALSSLAFSLPALAAVVVIGSQIPAVVTVTRRVEAGTLVISSLGGLIAVGILLVQLGLSCFLALIVHLLLRRFGRGGDIEPISGWTRVLRADRPTGHDVYVRVKLTNNAVWSGRVASFSPDLDVEQRELVLMPPLTTRGADPSNGLAPVPDDFQRVVFTGSQITSLAVQYRKPRDRPSSTASTRWRELVARARGARRGRG